MRTSLLLNCIWIQMEASLIIRKMNWYSVHKSLYDWWLIYLQNIFADFNWNFFVIIYIFALIQMSFDPKKLDEGITSNVSVKSSFMVRIFNCFLFNGRRLFLSTFLIWISTGFRWFGTFGTFLFTTFSISILIIHFDIRWRFLRLWDFFIILGWRGVDYGVLLWHYLIEFRFNLLSQFIILIFTFCLLWFFWVCSFWVIVFRGSSPRNSWARFLRRWFRILIHLVLLIAANQYAFLQYIWNYRF